MHQFSRVIPRNAAPERDPHLFEMLRACVEGAPGVNRVDTTEPHSRGGYAVSADREEDLPREIEEYFEKSAFMVVI